MAVDLFELPMLERRRYCECCEYPTLAIIDDVDGAPEWTFSGTACDLCEWESASLDNEGEPEATLAEERNDGLSLAVARAQLERYGSIYDPVSLPPWKLSAPSIEVIEARVALRAAYAEAQKASLAERWTPWETVQAREAELRGVLAAQQARDEELTDGAP